MKTDPEVIFAKQHIDTNNFIGFVHQNYVKFGTDMKEIAKCASYISDGDSVATSFMNRHQTDNISWGVTVRGIMYSITQKPEHKYSTIRGSSLRKQSIISRYNTKLVDEFVLTKPKYIKGENCNPTVMRTEVIPYFGSMQKSSKAQYGIEPSIHTCQN